MSEQAEPIRRTVTVPTPPDHTFRLFTGGMGTWWPVDEYSRVVNELQGEDVHVTRLEFEARLGGSVLEHVSDGRVLPWAEVVAWDPPRSVRLAWRPHALPEPHTELDVTFTAAGGGTLVEVEHGGWERLSPAFRDGLYDVYARGWTTTLERFRAAAAGERA